MPIYEYACLDCGEKFETLRSMNEADTPIVPDAILERAHAFVVSDLPDIGADEDEGDE